MRFNKEEKTGWLEEWKLSGKSAWSFAKEKGLKGQTFAKWVKSEKKNGFIEVHSKPKAVLKTSEVIIEKGEIKILGSSSFLPLGSAVAMY